MKASLMINVLHRAVKILLALLALMALTVHAQGTPLLVQHSSDMNGSGIGQECKAHTVATYTDYRAVK